MMRRWGCTPLCLLVLACGREAPAWKGGGEERGAFDAASGVARADTSASRPRVIPLRPMAGDVEILYGDPEKPGEPFVMRIRELPGTIIPLHSHPVDEHVTVVQGTWYFAVGDRWDRAALREMKPGTYAFAPKGSTMFGASPDGAVVQVHGVGPFHIHWRDGLKTLDDAGGAAAFRFRKGERVQAPRGRGTIRQGYASGEIVQYEVEAEGGGRFMADEKDLRRA
ncbi:MAG TPA: cupin domain-containing protein [Longimicrobium sp.]|jgi:quercetin dioxygenase-like cupin family protein